MENQSLIRTVDAIRGWCEQHHDELESVDTIELRGTYHIAIVPKNAKSSSIELWIGPGNIFDMSVGQAMTIGDLEYSDSLLLDICDSVRRGRLRETLWVTRKGKIIRSEGQLELSSEVWRDRGSNFLLGFLRRTSPRVVQYEPYFEVKEVKSD